MHVHCESSTAEGELLGKARCLGMGLGVAREGGVAGILWICWGEGQLGATHMRH